MKFNDADTRGRGRVGMADSGKHQYRPFTPARGVAVRWQRQARIRETPTLEAEAGGELGAREQALGGQSVVLQGRGGAARLWLGLT